MDPIPLTPATTASPAKGHNAYRPDIDGLRALAVVLVVAYHAAPSLLSGGFLGVDVFFVISGFLITGIIAREMREGQFTLAKFYVRRARRILPALCLVLLVTVVLGSLLLFPEEFSSLGVHVAAAAGFGSNFLLLSESGYFDLGSHSKPLLHLWSLAVEEQFYLVWPVLLLLSFRIRRARAIVLLFTILSLAVSVVWGRTNPTADFYMLPSRLWELSVGAILALGELDGDFKRAVDRVPEPAAEILCGAALLALLCASRFFNAKMVYPSAWAAIPVGATAILIDVLPRTRSMLAMLSLRGVVLVGLISYPLYLWHWPLLVYFENISNGMPEGQHKMGILAVVLVSFLLAWLTWKFVEKPAQRLTKTRFTRPALLLSTAGATLAMFALCGVAISGSDGFPGRVDGKLAVALQDLDMFKSNWRSYERRFSACSPTVAVGGEGLRCYKFEKDKPIEWALFGDSHADNLMVGISEAFPPNLVNVAYIGRHGCPPLLDVEVLDGHGQSTGCATVTRSALQLIVDDASIDTVLLAARGPIYIHGADFDKTTGFSRDLRSTIPSEASLDRYHLYLNGLTRTVDALRQHGKKVILVGDAPELDFNPASCVGRPFSLARRTDCAVHVADVRERQKSYQSVLESVASSHDGAVFFDPQSVFCGPLTCNARAGERMLYSDSNHLSLYGASRLGNALRSWLTTIPASPKA